MNKDEQVINAGRLSLLLDKADGNEVQSKVTSVIHEEEYCLH